MRELPTFAKEAATAISCAQLSEGREREKEEKRTQPVAESCAAAAAAAKPEVMLRDETTPRGFIEESEEM